MKGSPRGGACLAGRLERLLLQEASCHRALSGAPDAPVHTGQQGTLTQTPCHSSTGSTTALASSVKHHRYHLGWADPLEKKMATHSSILAWEISWKEEPDGLQSMGSQKSRTQLSD